MVERSYLLKIFVNNLSVVLEIFHVFNFRGTRKLFNLEHFLIYSNSQTQSRVHCHSYTYASMYKKMWIKYLIFVCSDIKYRR